MSTEKKTVTREYRVTVIVREVEAPKVAEIPEDALSPEAQEFVDEAGYSNR
ncbi:hypothetical protein RX330_22895 [Bradyrhizobium sp. NDS-1]|uniref:hypothetical protein n=1 Tax=Bradyrhizobium sp. NDS-1 TaxID=3080014 RepID=UPI00293ED85B|nr:hypothetical protein [Bradyrhizobium sp. NDS-1]WOH71130.1 hypothetical protein RX330_22895 [Bradyrhizobium sp. NDS-1]